jgi:FtsJ-like methyltransferase
MCKNIHYPPATTVEARKDLFRKALGKLFEPLQATEIFVPDNKHKNYAIISFATILSAEKALEMISLPHSLFDHLKEVKIDRPQKVNTRLPSPKERQQTATISRLNDIMATMHIDFILQCTRSHADRIEEILLDLHGELTVHVKGVHHIKDISLLFCQSSDDPHLVLNYLYSKWYIQDNFQRIFILKNTFGERPQTGYSMPLSSSRLFGASEIAGILPFATDHHNPRDFNCKYRIRLQVYPPRIHSQVLQRLEEAFATSKRLSEYCSCSPDRKAATHTVSVLELVPPLALNANNGYYILACTQASQELSKLSPPMVGRATCRAYWKIAEAVERYQYASPFSSGGGHGLDVGASPGGWTQYLIQAQGLSRVYSVDPGDLDARVLAMQADEVAGEGKRKKVPAVRHIRATYQSGIPQICQERRDTKDSAVFPVHQPIQWYVSDMCVKTLGEQIDALLLAVRHELVTSGTFILLTLKCTRGHSKATYDVLVAEQVDRIRHQMKDLQVLHLFSNRSSERTIMGYWK